MTLGAHPASANDSRMKEKGLFAASPTQVALRDAHCERHAPSAGRNCMPMRRLLVLLLGYLVGCKEAPSAGGGTPPGGRAPATPALLSELETLPVGLRVTHTPPEVRGPRGPNPDARDW